MRQLLSCLLFLFCSASTAAPTQTLVVTPLGSVGDERLRALERAVAFWNDALAGAGSHLRLDVGSLQENPLPADWFLSAVRDRGQVQPPIGLEAIDGDILVALVDAHFVSFTLKLPGDRRLVGMRSVKHRLLDHPGVAGNVLAHEIGHALGLGHNADPATLMCGAPSPCRPDRFASAQGALFSLTPAERAWLAQRQRL